jgi:DNA polymerase/3'-5' exonuclease PolX
MQEVFMDYVQALAIAEQTRTALAPYCERIEIAGSIRQRKPQVKDIELVAIPRQIPTGLFGDELVPDPDFCAVVNQWRKVKGEPTGKYTQRILPGGIKLDLFLVEPDSWGWQLCLRTGSTAFNRDVLLKSMHQQGYESDGGALQREGQVMPTPEEVDVFRLLLLLWIDPWARET